MENESKAFTQASPLMDPALSRPRLPRGDAAGRSAVKRWSARQAEWAILRSSSINGLIVGAPHLTAAAMALLEKSGRQPVVWWDPEQMSDIPEMIAGTLVIDDVERLDKSQQERLSRWIGVHGSARAGAGAGARAALRAGRGRTVFSRAVLPHQHRDG